MTVEVQSRMAEVQAALRQRRADDLNFAARQHLNYADFRVPVDKGNLQKTLRQTEGATPDSLRAVVVAGGMTVGDVTVDYAAAVNNGSHHVSSAGKHYTIPPDPFWTEAEDVGRQALALRGRIGTFVNKQSAGRGKRTSANDFETFEEAAEQNLFG